MHLATVLYYCDNYNLITFFDVMQVFVFIPFIFIEQHLILYLFFVHFTGTRA